MPPAITPTDIIRSIATWLRQANTADRKLFLLLLSGTMETNKTTGAV